MKYFSSSHNKTRSLRPPDLYEYFVDNFWFKTVDLENQKINEPLRGSHQADVVIVGGGYTGLSAAYHIRQKFPDKHIILLEGACCGYGASGRNGGFCIATDLLGEPQDIDPESQQKNLDVSLDENGDQLKNRVVTVKSGEKEEPWQISCITGATISSVAIGKILGESTSSWIPVIYQELDKIKGENE